MTTSSTHKDTGHKSPGMRCSLFGVGITILTDALPDAEIKSGGWTEIDNCVTSGFVAGIKVRPIAPPPPKSTAKDSYWDHTVPDQATQQLRSCLSMQDKACRPTPVEVQRSQGINSVL